MKKGIIIGILVLVVAVIMGIIIINKPEKVEKLSEVKIVDSYNQEIENYKENKMPFKIEKNNEQDKIFINGNEYNPKERMYEVGEYKVEVKSKNKKEETIIKINQVEKKEENTYRIYIIAETLQTLLANLDMSTNVNQKGFMWTSRTSTINLDKVKNNLPNIQISNNCGEEKITKFKEEIVPEIKEYVEKTIKEDENACFELYMEEDKFYLDLELFGKIGLDDSRYTVKMYTDGTLGYQRKYEMTQENKQERFEKEKQNYNQIVKQIKNDTINSNDYPGSYLVDSESSVFSIELNFDYMLISTLRNNIKLLLQYPEMIEYKDEKVKQEMEKANIEKLVVQDEFKKLSEEQRKVFFDNIDLNKEELDEKYFTDLSKNYLIITGTVPFYGEYRKEEKFKEVIEQVNSEYSSEYVILYKPHPRALPTEEQEKYLNDLGIKVLPGKLPMEAISFVYPNLKLGGFDSSLYMSTDEGKTLFFFARDKNDLWSPLDQLYDLMFAGAKFYN